MQHDIRCGTWGRVQNKLIYREWNKVAGMPTIRNFPRIESPAGLIERGKTCWEETFLAPKSTAIDELWDQRIGWHRIQSEVIRDRYRGVYFNYAGNTFGGFRMWFMRA